MIGLVLAVVGATPFVAVDGGYTAQPRVPVIHRTIEVFVPAQAGPFVVSAGDAPETKLPISIEPALAAALSDGGVRIGADTSLEVTEPLTVQLKRTGSLTIRLSQGISRKLGARFFIDLPRASFALIPSTPFEELGNGVLRVTDAVATIDVQLQVSGPPIPWPVIGAWQSWSAGLVWDAARGRLTRFGGGDATELEEGTSIWDPLAGWQVLPITSPPPRVRASLVYDSIRQRTVLFGGLGAAGLLSDTWEFDGNQWLDVTPATGPSARWSHGAAFDEDSGVMILFGGLAGPDSSNLELNDTWSWNGFTWTQLQPPNSPSPRDAFGMAWDGTRHRVTIAGGWDGVNVLSETWAWIGGTWQPLAPVPAPRSSAAMAWSPVSHDLILVGGWDPRGIPVFYASTLRFDGTTWNAGADLGQPSARMALAGHPTMGVVMHGGWNGSGFTGDTAQLEPTYQRLPQGDREERTVTSGSFVAGERYLWVASVDLTTGSPIGPMKTHWRIPRGMHALGMASGSNLYGESDGGMVGWYVHTGGYEIAAPPRFQSVGGELGWDWALDLDGGLHLLGSDSAWHFVATAPSGLRALHTRHANPGNNQGEYLAWTDRLHIWTPLDGGFVAFGDPLELDGGVSLLPTLSTAIVTEARGSWHLASTGEWIFFGQPRLEEPPIDGVVITDAGLAGYAYYKPLGARCERSEECLRGLCADGRCCSSQCDTCQVCSVEAGGQIDGECTAARAGKPCFDAGCGVQTCDGVHSYCPAIPPDFCPVDAGLPEPEFDAGPRPDAGVRPRDAGTSRPAPEPEPKPGCGCEASAGSLWFASALLLRARRPSRSDSNPGHR